MKKNWKLIVGILFVIGGLGCLPDIGATIFGIVVGAVLIYLWYKNYKAQKLTKEMVSTRLYKVKGVTYANDNGTERQAILKKAYESGDYSSRLNFVDFEGKPAIEVLVNEECCGFISREEITEVRALAPHIDNAKVYIENFKSNEGDIVYRADVVIKVK